MQDVSELSKLFKLYNQETGKDEPVILTEGQRKIFEIIVKRKPKYNHVISTTQYGKSEVVSMAVLLRAINFGEKWAVVAPSMAKAQIIMGNIRKHCFDNDIFKDQLNMDAKEKDRLKREISKSRLTFKQGGEIFVLSADNKNKAASGESLMGFGCILAGEKIMTNIGEIEIDRVVKEKLPVKILTHNHNTNSNEFKDILEYQENKLGDRYMLEIDLGDRKIKCTNDHPVYVENKGYIKAEDIISGDKVYVL